MSNAIKYAFGTSDLTPLYQTLLRDIQRERKLSGSLLFPIRHPQHHRVILQRRRSCDTAPHLVRSLLSKRSPFINFSHLIINFTFTTRHALYMGLSRTLLRERCTVEFDKLMTKDRGIAQNWAQRKKCRKLSRILSSILISYRPSHRDTCTNNSVGISFGERKPKIFNFN